MTLSRVVSDFSYISYGVSRRPSFLLGVSLEVLSAGIFYVIVMMLYTARRKVR